MENKREQQKTEKNREKPEGNREKTEGNREKPEGTREKKEGNREKTERNDREAVREKLKADLDKLLKKVEKPARYTGLEVNSVMKDPDTVSVRFAFAFPDTRKSRQRFTFWRSCGPCPPGGESVFPARPSPPDPP